MAYEHMIRLRVAFADTDMAGIVHFAKYFHYMEAAEHDFFRSLGHSIVTRIDGRQYGWPRVNVECQFSGPLRFEDEFEVRLLVDEVRTRSIRYVFVFTRLTADGGRATVGRGSITAVCVTHDDPSEPMVSVAIPRRIAELIETAPREVLQASMAKENHP